MAITRKLRRRAHPTFLTFWAQELSNAPTTCWPLPKHFVKNELCFKSLKHKNSASHNLYINFSKMHPIMFAAATESANHRRHHHAGLALPNWQDWLMGASRIQLFRLELPSPWLPAHHDNSQPYSMHLDWENLILKYLCWITVQLTWVAANRVNPNRDNELD